MSIDARPTFDQDECAGFKIIVVGGGARRAVDRIINTGRIGFECVALDNDLQDMGTSAAVKNLWIDEQRPRGLGVDPDWTRMVVESCCDEIGRSMGDATRIWVVACLGGVMGTVAAPIVARIARDNGIPTVGVVTLPHAVEGQVRRYRAEDACERIKALVDSLRVIDLDRLLDGSERTTTLPEAFRLADEALGKVIRHSMSIQFRR
jgi:cell division protein FtsZ